MEFLKKYREWSETNGLRIQYNTVNSFVSVKCDDVKIFKFGLVNIIALPIFKLFMKTGEGYAEVINMDRISGEYWKRCIRTL